MCKCFLHGLTTSRLTKTEMDLLVKWADSSDENVQQVIPMSITTTRGIQIAVKPRFLAAESRPEANQFVFAYDITISNLGQQGAKLDSRHWVITNGNGESQDVRGPGVVGQQPYLAPGDRFGYSSFCPLDTPVGTMAGSFQMIDDSGQCFDAEIAPFRLSLPGTVN